MKRCRKVVIMRKLVVGTVIAMVVSLGTLTAQGITANAAELQRSNVEGFHTVSKEFELDGTEGPTKTISDEEREELYKKIEENNQESIIAKSLREAQEGLARLSSLFGC